MIARAKTIHEKILKKNGAMIVGSIEISDEELEEEVQASEDPIWQSTVSSSQAQEEIVEPERKLDDTDDEEVPPSTQPRPLAISDSIPSPPLLPSSSPVNSVDSVSLSQSSLPGLEPSSSQEKEDSSFVPPPRAVRSSAQSSSSSSTAAPLRHQKRTFQQMRDTKVAERNSLSSLASTLVGTTVKRVH